jgi:hypothetical protein
MFLQAMVRHVRFDGEDLNAVPMAVRADTTDLRPGTRLEVLIGARKGGGHREDRPGHWILCEVVSESSREIIVKVLT